MEKYGRLTVLETYKKGSKLYAHCLCECGNETHSRYEQLLSGRTKSCGCWRSDYQRKAIVERSKTHGMSKTRLYRIWAGIKNRCDNPNVKMYKHYGGRGIGYTPEWKSFEPFRDWANANGYNDNLTIDRIDNDGDYCPENCRWITQAEQASNRRSCHYIECNGERHTMTEWARITGIPYHNIKNRINNLGWSPERALEVI